MTHPKNQAKMTHLWNRAEMTRPNWAKPTHLGNQAKMIWPNGNKAKMTQIRKKRLKVTGQKLYFIPYLDSRHLAFW